MNSVMLRYARRLTALVIILTYAAFAASPKVEHTALLPGNAVSDALRQSVAEKGYRVTLEDGWTAEFWFARELSLEKKDAPGALYPQLTNGEFIGIARFLQGMSDFRGQSLPSGYYTLRYQILPQDGNHMGVAPDPDFLLASPAAADTRPEQAYVYRKLVALSAKSTGTGHPAVIALQTAGQSGTVVKEDNGNILFSVDVAASGGASEKLGIVVKGAAAQ
jgi:hypothetical protein